MSAVLALILLGSGALLTMTLVQECGAGTDVVRTWVASIRRGASVSGEIGGEEAQALTDVLRRTDSVSISNFQAQAQTSCYWVRLEHGDDSTPAYILLEERADGLRVIGASLHRECTCPDPDFEQRCRFE
jgi:hypothetical protein